MNLAEIIKSLNLKIISGKLNPETKIKGVYVSDLLSDVMGNAKAGDLWITLQSHKNIIAVAELKDICAILIINGGQPDEETIKKSREDDILLLGTDESAFSMAGRIYELFKKHELL
ncbi:MAG: serine kinase [Bacteroidales bacterium]|nr:serine kinase [Bacteroidales bacterium]MCF8390500.1 serine kinase [Bacteroidales bacterium]